MDADGSVDRTSTNAIREALVKLLNDTYVFFGGDPVADRKLLRRFFADLQMYAVSSGIDPQQDLAAPLCKHIQTRDNNWSSSNNARSCDPEYDELFAQLEQTRMDRMGGALLNNTYVQGYYEIPLVDRGAVSAHLNTLLGVRINGWDSELWNIAEWRR